MNFKRLCRFVPILAAFLILVGCSSSEMLIRNMTCEYMDRPMGLDVRNPRFSWKYGTQDTSAYGQGQTAYRIMVSTDSSFRDKSCVMWDSGWVLSSSSTLVEYSGNSLASDRKYFWKVNAKDEKGRTTGWSKVSEWTTGLFDSSEWSAEWIGCDDVYMPEYGECNIWDPWFRKIIALEKRPEKALMFLASIGYHELYVNGVKVNGDDVLAPAVTDHSIRARYVTYDIAPYLKKGDNVIAVWLGTSWSIFEPYFIGKKPLTPTFIAQSDIYYDYPYTDDEEADFRLISDTTWLTHPSPNKLLGNWSMRNMGGEIWDAKAEIEDWNLISCDETQWKNSTEYDVDLELSAQNVYPTRKYEEIHPVSISRMSDGSFRVDMGVNFAGWTEIRVKGDPGTRVDFEFSERENEQMTFNNHSAYIIGKNGEGKFKNRFNYSSGRWITIRGLDYAPSASDVVGWTLRTAYPEVSSFSCSDDLHNWIYDRVMWTFRNLSIGGYIVDCPQRERLGYGGDAHATSETGLYNYDMGAFYTKWMQDWRDAQGRESNMGKRIGGGILPHTAPTNNGGGGPAWGGITVMLPWFMYQQYGDIRILKDNYSMISAWLDFLDSHSDDGILKRFGGEWDFLADWLWPGATAEGMNNDKPQAECFNSCYYALNLATAAKIADILQYENDAEHWRQMAEKTRKAVHLKYYDANDSSYCDGSMGNLTAALAAGVPPADCRQSVFERLEKEIMENCSGHIDVGITGGALLFMLLREEHRDDLLYTMASKTDYPSWGYMRENGATSIWEMWEKDLPGHSLLHSSFLFPGAWYIEGVGGIGRDINSPGFSKFVLKVPQLYDQLDYAQATYDSINGLISSSWRVSDGRIEYDVIVPPNSSATVKIPVRTDMDVIELSGHAHYDGIKSRNHEFSVKSGRYYFREKSK